MIFWSILGIIGLFMMLILVMWSAPRTLLGWVLFGGWWLDAVECLLNAIVALIDGMSSE